MSPDRPDPFTMPVLDILFGYKSEYEDEAILQQLSSYLNDLIKTMGDDLLWSGAP